LPAVLILQLTLGIVTLLLAVPVALAAAHQAGALLLLTCALMVNHRLQLTADPGEEARPAAPRLATV
jgi:heme A synthase